MKVEIVSFFFQGERVKLKVNSQGKFKLPVFENVAGSLKKLNRYFTPRQVVEHRKIKELDPFITLKGGEKMRVYQGGDPSYMLVQVESILDAHEECLKEQRKKRNIASSFSGLSPRWDDYEDIF